MKSLLSKEHFFQILCERNLGFFNFFLSLNSRLFVGKPINLYFFNVNIPTTVSFLLKGAPHLCFELLSSVIPVRVIFGVCVSMKKKGFGSSIAIRYVDDGYLVHREFKLFSPYFFFIEPVVLRIPLKNSKRFKSKLYFLTYSSQKKLLSRIYL